MASIRGLTRFLEATHYFIGIFSAIVGSISTYVYMELQPPPEIPPFERLQDCEFQNTNLINNVNALNQSLALERKQIKQLEEQLLLLHRDVSNAKNCGFIQQQITGINQQIDRLLNPIYGEPNAQDEKKISELRNHVVEHIKQFKNCMD